MKRLIALTAIVGLLSLGSGAAEAASGGCQCSTPVAAAPAPSATPTATTAQIQPTTGYRSYSYQPGTYQPATNYRSSRAPAGVNHDASWKIRGGN